MCPGAYITGLIGIGFLTLGILRVVIADFGRNTLLNKFWLPVSAWSWAERPRIPENQRLIKSTTRSNNCEMFIFAFKMKKIRMQ